ncbi:PREDICTED: LOW QUALITY PROTEIN: olfactory receptor 1013 [Leptosomus discolor]|uniref:LOW QUALITY PROTEIN: olfactory receptor 1013 n=1 Tax=Leptosomus discolor TaxID=188344 RepID=UPI00052286FD|nr:PREDICTED: LOW QUALITY PROTEIN: olfactory receptor 1013 [Leptosomus discolor]
MEKQNHSSVPTFILLGFTTDPKLQLLLFMVFTLAYVTTLVGNITLIVVIHRRSQLHTPMYFFTGNLSFLDLWCSSIYAPKILLNYVSKDKSVSFTGCAAPFFVSGGLAYTECYLLAAMAYDQHVAISNPLLYTAAVSKKLRMGLVAASYLSGFANSTVITSRAFALTFCNSNVIDDFFCDLPPLVKLSCNVTESYHALLYFILTFNVILPSALILTSYASMPAAVLKMRSAEGQSKAFSASATHLTAVTLYYSSILFTYARPSSTYVLGRDKAISVFYAVVIPMLNPFIYSLRNQEVKEALKRLVKRQTASWQKKSSDYVPQRCSKKYRPNSSESCTAYVSGWDQAARAGLLLDENGLEGAT